LIGLGQLALVIPGYERFLFLLLLLHLLEPFLLAFLLLLQEGTLLFDVDLLQFRRLFIIVILLIRFIAFCFNLFG
jgi:hypothetical protein